MSFAIYPAGGFVSFDDGLLGSETLDRRWEALLSALLKFRADRPFDGLVIVLPASDFFGADKKPEDALMLRGDELYQMIWVAQRAGGCWRVPIYLVLSGCEVLTGFCGDHRRSERAAVVTTKLGFWLGRPLSTRERLRAKLGPRGRRCVGEAAVGAPDTAANAAARHQNFRRAAAIP